MAEQLSVHSIKGKFYAYKRMIGTERFYFGRDLGIVADSNTNHRNAVIASNVYVQEWHRLKAAGESWTPAAKDRAKMSAKVVLGLHQPPAGEDETPFEMSTPAPAPTKTKLMLHAAIEAYIERTRERAASGQISEGRADTIRHAILRAKAFMVDRALTDIKLDDCRAVVNHFAGRPIVAKFKRPMAPDTVIDTIVAARAFFADAEDRSEWTPPASLRKCFGFKRDKLLTEEELDARANVPTFNVKELTTIWKFNHHDRRQLYMLLALNCGFTQRDIATLRKTHCFDLASERPYIKRRRAKTKVMGKWRLWPETAYMLRQHFCKDKEQPLALLHGAKDRPLISRVVGSRYDVIRNEWDHVLRAVDKGHTAAPTKSAAARRLSFKFLRKTGSNMVRRIAGRDVAETYLAHTDRTMSKVYHNPDFKRLAGALRKLRRRLQPMFDAAPSVLPKPAQTTSAKAVAKSTAARSGIAGV